MDACNISDSQIKIKESPNLFLLSVILLFDNSVKIDTKS